MADAAASKQQNKDQTMTKADLVEEVTRVTELPRKESEAVVETIFESIISAPCRPTIKSRSAASAASARASAADAPGATPRPARKWKSRRRKSPISSPARN